MDAYAAMIVYVEAIKGYVEAMKGYVEAMKGYVQAMKGYVSGGALLICTVLRDLVQIESLSRI